MQGHVSSNGYIELTIFDENGRKKVRPLHRLILEAFVGRCPKDHEGCHKDGDRQNPRLDNLYWGTRSQNSFDRVRHERHPLAKMTCEQTEEALRLHGEGWSFVALGERYGVRHTSIRNRLMNQGVDKSFSRIGPDELRRLQLLDALGFQRKTIAKMAGRSVNALHRVLGDAPGWERKTTPQRGQRGLRRKYRQEASAS
jgi:hypothetical protein